jgi:hypothetical protein
MNLDEKLKIYLLYENVQNGKFHDNFPNSPSFSTMQSHAQM